MAWLLTWLVQGLAITLIARLTLRALPGLSAATRYALWWATLTLVLILPIVRGLTISRGPSASAATATSAAAVSSASSNSDIAPADAPVPGVIDATTASSPTDSLDAGAVTFDAEAISPLRSATLRLQSFSLPPVALPRVPDWLLSIVIGLWLGGAMLGLAQVAYSVQAVRRLKESCRRMIMPRESDLPMWSAVRDRGRTVRVRASDRVRTAAVLGLTRPVIAVPRDASGALTAHEIDQIVLHEYAHVQRYDDWTKLAQVLIGAFFGWHPAVRLMMREIDFEREAACDDYVVDITGAPRAYARCLTKVIEMMPGPGLAAVPYASSSASHTTTRIERLLDRRRPAGRLAMMPAMAGSATLAVLAFCTVHALPIATDLPRASSSPTRGVSLASAAGTGGSGGITNAGGERTPATRDASVAAVAADTNANGSDNPETPRVQVRIAAASTLPIKLPFSGFSPLSRLTNARLSESRTTTPPAPAAAPPATVAPASVASNTPDMSAMSGTFAPSPEARDSSAAYLASAATMPATPATAPRHTRNDRTGAAGRQPVRPPDVASAAPQHAEANFALGPVASATESDAMPEASDAGHIGRAWESTRDATSKAMGASARAVGIATRTAGEATLTATNKAAAGVKTSSAKTARAVGRGVKRTLASVF